MLEIIGRIFRPHSDNRKSAIQNPKWLGLSVIACVLVVVGAVAQAQQTGKIFRIGFLDSSTASGSAVLVDVFRQELSKLGWIEGKHLTIDYRYAENKGADRASELAADLVRLKVDLIVVTGTGTASATKSATTTIPIVMTSAVDPVGAGLVTSLARPGGNITGFTAQSVELNTKRLEILTDAVPKLARVGLLRGPGSSTICGCETEANTGRDRDGPRRQRFRKRLSNCEAEAG